MGQDLQTSHREMVTAEQALDLVLEDATPLEPEMITLDQASGRVLASDLQARRTQPPFPASAMDGYAVRHADISGPSSVLALVGESAAGHPYDGQVKPGECVRIFTGAPVPADTDTIIIQENVTANGSQIIINQSAPMGKFVRPAGLDFKSGETLLLAGTVLDPQSLSLCASMDYAEVTVVRKPRIAVLATGDELVMPGEKTAEGQIIASNTFGIAAIAATAGGEVSNLGIASDRLEDLETRIRGALNRGADLIVTSGGASVGDHDLVKPAMESFGFEFSFVKIAMRPGKPVLFGRTVIDGFERRFLGLAGNPVSSIVSSHIFLKPLIGLLGGRKAETVRPISAILAKPLSANDERQDYMRGTARRGPDGKLLVEAFQKQDSSMLATLSRSDCLIIRPVNAPAAEAGDRVDIILLRDV